MKFANHPVLAEESIAERWLGHFDMLHDVNRNFKYAKAIEKELKNHPSIHNLAIDVGCGSGLLGSLVAKNTPSMKIIGFECVPELAKIARQTVYLNNNIEKMNIWLANTASLDARFMRRTFGQKANVIVSELLDTTLLGEGLLESLIHAQRHLLAEPLSQVTIIPNSCKVFVQGWDSTVLLNMARVNFGGFGLKLSSHLQSCSGNSSASTIHMSKILSTANPITPVVEVLSFDFNKDLSKYEEFKYHIAQVALPITASGRVDAVVMWWECAMDREGEYMLSTSPDRCSPPPDHWRQAVFFQNHASTNEDDIIFSKDTVVQLCVCHDLDDIWVQVNRHDLGVDINEFPDKRFSLNAVEADGKLENNERRYDVDEHDIKADDQVTGHKRIRCEHSNVDRDKDEDDGRDAATSACYGIHVEQINQEIVSEQCRATIASSSIVSNLHSLPIPHPRCTCGLHASCDCFRIACLNSDQQKRFISHQLDYIISLIQTTVLISKESLNKRFLELDLVYFTDNCVAPIMLYKRLVEISGTDDWTAVDLNVRLLICVTSQPSKIAVENVLEANRVMDTSPGCIYNIDVQVLVFTFNQDESDSDTSQSGISDQKYGLDVSDWLSDLKQLLRRDSIGSSSKSASECLHAGSSIFKCDNRDSKRKTYQKCFFVGEPYFAVLDGNWSFEHAIFYRDTMSSLQRSLFTTTEASRPYNITTIPLVLHIWVSLLHCPALWRAYCGEVGEVEGVDMSAINSLREECEHRDDLGLISARLSQWHGTISQETYVCKYDITAEDDPDDVPDGVSFRHRVHLCCSHNGDTASGSATNSRHRGSAGPSEHPRQHVQHPSHHQSERHSSNTSSLKAEGLVFWCDFELETSQLNPNSKPLSASHAEGLCPYPQGHSTRTEDRRTAVLGPDRVGVDCLSANPRMHPESLQAVRFFDRPYDLYPCDVEKKSHEDNINGVNIQHEGDSLHSVIVDIEIINGKFSVRIVDD